MNYTTNIVKKIQDFNAYLRFIFNSNFTIYDIIICTYVMDIMFRILLLTLFLTACSTNNKPLLVSCGDIEKLTGLPQKIDKFADLATDFHPDINHFKNEFFAPWTNAPSTICPHIVDKKTISKYYADNLSLWCEDDINCLIDKTENLLTVNKPAILIRNTMCKTYPTEIPMFSDIHAPGGNFPFDDNIRSVFKIGTPVFVYTLSKNRQWAFVLSNLCSGWIKRADFAYVDKAFIDHYRAQKLGVFVSENVDIESKTEFHERVNIGTILPIVSNRVLIPTKKPNGNAFLRWAIHNKEVLKFPLSFSKDNIESIGNKLLNNRYYWGGSTYGGRDCSLTIRDFMVTFGLNLPRNSKGQIFHNRQNSDLFFFDKMTTQEKEKYIIEYGIPFLSLIYLPGHIMLYVGQNNGKPVFFHNVMGMCRFDTKGRFVAGKTVLSHGDDTLKTFPNEKTLLDKISMMRNISSI